MTMTQAFQNAATRTIQVKDTRMVYRELGERGGVPVVFLHHLTAVLDDWDPKVLDGIAGSHHVVIFDNRGVGGSGGQTPVSVADMAEDAIAFIEALGFAQVDLFGFSLGGFVAQVIAQTRPELVRKIVLAGTGPAGGVGISDVGTILQGAFQKSGAPFPSKPEGGGCVPAASRGASGRSRHGRQRSDRPGPAYGNRQMGPGAELERDAEAGPAPSPDRQW